MDKIILVIGYVWPEPSSSAAGRHMLSLIRLFRDAGWVVHFASPAAKGEHEVDLEAEDVVPHEIRLNCSSFDVFVSELQPLAVLFDRYMMEEQFSWRVAKECPRALRLLDLEDVHSLRDARHTMVKGELTEMIDLNTDLAKREAAAIFRSDLSLVISEVEIEFLQNQYLIPDYLLEYCPLMLDVEEVETPSFEEREHFIFIGNYRHAPNWDAVLCLKQQVWPKIRELLPNAELHLYGAYPPPKLTQLHDEKTGFQVKGWASDAAAVVSKAKVCLAPIRFGAGIKGKLIEAMMCGTPSVTTSIGAEGIQGAEVWPGAIADSMDAFAQQAVSLYDNAEVWEQMKEHGLGLLKRRFNKEETGSRVIERVESLLEAIEPHRKQNFIGGMLQHQSMKAAQYMSQWIEEKNR